MANEIQEALIAELTRHGVERHRVEMGGKHPRLYFTAGGRERFYVFPGSSSDRRAALNAVTDIRGMLREAGCVATASAKISTTTVKKRRPRPAPTPIEPPTLNWSPLKNPFAQLVTLADPVAAMLSRLDAHADEACYRLSFFRGSFKRWVAAGRPTK